MRVREDEVSATVYCPACWGTGQLYAPPAAVDGAAASSCGSCYTTSVDDLTPTPCIRCTGLVLAQPSMPTGGTA
jgi:hypothetical protein